MATFYDPSAASAGQVGNTSYSQISPTSDPTFARLLEQIQAITPTSLPGINDIVSGGMNSPLLQLVLGPALARLQAPQATQRQNLTEQTRAAGGLRGSTYGQDMNKLVANQGLQQNDLMAQVIQQMLGTLISGSLQSQQNSMLPGKSLTDLLRTIAPQTVTGSNAAAGGSSGGGINDPFGVLSQPSIFDSSPYAGASVGGVNPGGGKVTPGYSGVSGGVGSAATGGTTSPYKPYLDPFSSKGGYKPETVTEGWW